MTTRKYDFDYNYDPVGTSIVKPDPYMDQIDAPDAVGAFMSPKSQPRTPIRKAKSPSQPATSSPQRSRTRTPSPPEQSLRKPSEEYLSISAQLSSKLENPSSHRKLLVLDLNGTLVYRSPHKRRSVYQQPSNAPRPLRSVNARPYLSSFRDYLFHPKTKEWLDTMVWSSAQPHSVSDMVQKAFGSADGLKAIWARDTLGLSKDAYFQKTQTTKDLEKPWQALGHSARSTFLLDDSPDKAHLQPWNHLCIREYVSEMRNTDLQVHEAEVLREKKAHVDSAAATPQLSSSSTEASDDTRTQKRKEKKERKKAEKLAGLTQQDLYPVDSQGQPLDYDQTLLAVIGVLDAIKEEDNVAGWTRNGGLIDGSRARSTPVNGPLTKKRRVSGESNASEPPSSSSPPQSPVEDVAGHSIPQEQAQATPLASNLWFENQESFSGWAERGRRALEQLGIEITPGIVGSDGS